jgi:membrane associated rhomboid family serine protease
MGIYDRDYYRREGPSFLGSFATQGQVCKWLIITNAIAFVFQFITLPRGGGFGWGPFTDLFQLEPDAVFRGEIWRLLTYAFLHAPNSLWHILWNMLFLWWFGHELEEMYGRWEFLAFYLLSALLGGIAYTLAWKGGIGPGAPCVGASGAVTAVMVLFAFHYPTRIILLFFVLPVPIWVLVAFQVLQDSFGFLSGNDSGVAVTVHLAGAGFGALYYQTNLHLLGMLPRFHLGQRQRSRPRLRVYREEEAETPQPVSVGAAPGGDVDEQLEAKLDAILEKVARSGQGSLTDNERQILLRASEIYKKRRS